MLAWSFYQPSPQNLEDQDTSEQVSDACEQEYNSVLNEEMDVENISENCRPIPDDVGDQILAMQLQG